MQYVGLLGFRLQRIAPEWKVYSKGDVNERRIIIDKNKISIKYGKINIVYSCRRIIYILNQKNLQKKVPEIWIKTEKSGI